MKNIPYMNPIIAVFFVLGTIGLVWLNNLGIKAGSTYLWIIFMGIIFILIGVAVKLTKKFDFYYDSPINPSQERAILTLFLGFVFLGLFILVSSGFGLNIYNEQTIAPLAQTSLGINSETFSAVQAQTSSFWTAFIMIFSASVVEETVLGIAAVFIGSLILGYMLRTLLGRDFGTFGNNVWDFFGGIIFSVILFSVLHFFNGSYLNVDGSWNWGLFGYAAMFRFVINMLIYKFGHFGLSFGIGVHALHNAIVLGKDIVIDALLTFPGGIIMIILMLLFVIYSFIRIKKMVSEGRNIFVELFSYERSIQNG